MKPLGMLVAISLAAVALPTRPIACPDSPPAIPGKPLYYAEGASGTWFASNRTPDRAVRLCELAHEATCRYHGQW